MRKVVSLISFIIFVQSLMAISINDRVFYQVFPEDYLARQSYSITKTDDGFMWFVNGYGVSRYDGKELKNYLIENDWRGFIKQSKTGELFVTTYKGMGYKYNPVTDTFDNIFQLFVDNKLSEKILKEKNNEIFSESFYLAPKSKSINSMEIDSLGRIWLSTSIATFCYNPNNGKWISLNHKNYIVNFLLVEKNKLYLFGNDKISNVNLVDSEQTKQPILTLVNINTSNGITAAYIDAQSKNIYYGVFNKGLFCLNAQGEVQHLLEIKNTPLRTIKLYEHNLLLIGIDGLGIYEYNTDSNLIVAKQSENVDQQHILGSNGVFDIYIDDKKRIWVATNSKGINLYDPGMLYFEQLSHQVNVPNSLVHNYVHAIFEDEKKNLWFGTNDGVSVLNISMNKWTHLLNNKVIADHNTGVFNINGNMNGTVWIGRYGYSLATASTNNLSVNTPTLIHSSKSSINNFQYKLIYDGALLWGGGVESQFFSYDPIADKVAYYNVFGVKMVVQEDQNNLWLLTKNKISLFNKSTETQNFELQDLINSTFKDNVYEYNCIRRDGKELWIGTEKSGLIKYSSSTNNIEQFSVKDGLPSNNILSIEVDNNNCIWFSTDVGLCYFNPATKVAVQFKTLNVSEKNVFNPMASFKCADGTLVFGTKQGVVRFLPSKFMFSPNRGGLAFTKLSIYNQNKNKRSIPDVLSNDLNLTNKLVLRHSENSFKIQFQELNYSQNIYTRYTHCLKGFEKTFSDKTIDNSVAYYNLPPGNYELTVRSYFADKNGAFMERSLTIVVLQPWYNTIWAWMVWMSMILSLAYIIYRFNRRKMERRYSDEKIKFFINVSHDMRTPITLIKAPLGDLVNDTSLPTNARYLVHTINNNVNRLFNMINRVLDFEKSDENEMSLQLQDMELNNYVQDVVENYHSYADIKGISIEEHTLNEPVWVSFDRNKMDMVIENIVSNAIKYTPQGGQVKVIAGCSDEQWWIDVEDNGIGIPSNEQKKIFNRFFRAENAINSKQIGSGMGLLLVNNLTRFMGGTVSFKSDENVKTTFRVSFPRIKTMSQISTLSQSMFDTSEEQTKDETAKPTLVFVDDNDEIRNYIANRLGAVYNILTAESADEALKIIANIVPDIIISDIMMPKVSGIELCEIVKADAKYAHIPFVLLSALSDKRDIHKGLQIGADDYITKPFDSEFLQIRIESLLKNKKRLENYFSKSNADVSKLVEQEFVNELDILFLNKLEKIFDANISDAAYTIDMLSRDMGMSRSVLYNRMKNLLNTSPNDYLRSRRMEKAAELLKMKRYTVFEVADMVGYNDVKYFSSLFSKNFDCLPSKYADEVSKSAK